MEIEEKAKIILEQAKKFMKISKHKKLSCDDINNSIGYFNMKKINPIIAIDNNSDFEIDIDKFITQPLEKMELKPTVYFHWFNIKGQIPNICANKIKNEIIYSNINDCNKEIIQQGNKKIIQQFSKNLSKELIIFEENFEEIFQRDISENLINNSIFPKISKEMEINLTILQIEPGIVPLLPYLLNYLIDEIKNETSILKSKIHLIILYHINAIINNKYFNTLPFLKNIINCLIYLIINDFETKEIVTQSSIICIMKVKSFSVEIIKKSLLKVSEEKSNEIIEEIFQGFKNYIIPSKINSKYFSSFGTIRGINYLCPKHVNDYIMNNLNLIIKTLHEDCEIELPNKKILKGIYQDNVKPPMTLNKTINIINVNNTQQKNSQFGNNSINNSSLLSFSMPLIHSGFNHNILDSIIHNSNSINNSNVLQNTGNSNNLHYPNNQIKPIGRIEFSIEDKKNDYNLNINIASCILYALIESIIIYLNNDERDNKLEGIFNEDIIQEIKNQVMDYSYLDNILNKYDNN